MAFCTSCGKAIEANARFCPACGAPASGAAPAGPAAVAAQPTPVSPAPAGGGGALRTVLIVLAVVIVLGIVGSICIAIVGLRAARNARIEARGDNATVATPFGEIKSTNDPVEVAKDLGISVYPGAKPLAGAGSVNLPGIHVAGAEFVTDDPVDKVGDYYRKQFPNSKIDVAEQNQQSIVVTTNKGMISIQVQREGDRTHIHLANLGGKPEKSETE